MSPTMDAGIRRVVTPVEHSAGVTATTMKEVPTLAVVTCPARLVTLRRQVPETWVCPRGSQVDRGRKACRGKEEEQAEAHRRDSDCQGGAPVCSALPSIDSRTLNLRAQQHGSYEHARVGGINRQLRHPERQRLST
jgi:hypothetical protein